MIRLWHTATGEALRMPSLRLDLAVVLCAAAAAGAAAQRPNLALRYQDAWYQENGLQDPRQAAAGYRAVADAEGADATLAAKALLRLAACQRQMGDGDAAGEVELEARRRFPGEIGKFPTYQLEVLEKQLDEAFHVGDAETAAQAVARFLDGLDDMTVRTICESVYARARLLRERDPVASIPMLRKAVAISTYLRQLARSAYAQKDIGDIYAAAGQYGQAIAAYRKTQQDFPTVKGAGAWAQLGIAETHRLESRLPEAVAAYRAVERDYPGQLAQVLWAHLWMGDAYRAAGRMADAMAAWRRVVEEFNEPDHADKLALAALLLGQAEPGQVIRSPGGEFANDVAYFLAVRAVMDERQDRARRYYRRCVELSRGNDWPRPLAARALATLEAAAEP